MDLRGEGPGTRTRRRRRSDPPGSDSRAGWPFTTALASVCGQKTDVLGFVGVSNDLAAKCSSPRLLLGQHAQRERRRESGTADGARDISRLCCL